MEKWQRIRLEKYTGTKSKKGLSHTEVFEVYQHECRLLQRVKMGAEEETAVVCMSYM